MTLKKTLFFLVAMFLAASCDSGKTNSKPPAEITAETPDLTPIRHDRLLAIPTTRNFRDLGGYRVADGRSVKWGMLYRSDSIAHLNVEALTQLKALELAIITDLRSDTERSDDPDRIPVQEPPIIHQTIAINDHSVDVSAMGKRIFAGTITQAELDSVVSQRRFTKNPEIMAAWGQWITELAEPGNLPQLFHCTSGKDRSGFGAAMILLTLGVSEEQIMEDFLLSNVYLEEFIENTISKVNSHKSDVDTEMLRSIMGVRAETLEGTFAQAREEYGSLDEFIRLGLGINDETRSKLQALLLE